MAEILDSLGDQSFSGRLSGISSVSTDSHFVCPFPSCSHHSSDKALKKAGIISHIQKKH